MKAVPLKCPYCGNTNNTPGRELEFGLEFKCSVCGTTSVLVMNPAGADSKSKDGLTTVRSPRHQYTVKKLLAKGDISNLYLCTYKTGATKHQAVFKVTRDPAENDLVFNEGRTLQHLAEGDDGDFVPYYPRLLETFLYQDGDSDALRNANILMFDKELKSLEELYSLAEVRAHYVEGIDPKDMAWMWRRVLVVLGFAHQNSVIHGAVLPTHILIHPGLHAVILIDWAYAVHDPATTGEKIRAISTDYEAWYPKLVFDKKTPTTGLDIAMAAKCMMHLLGADGARGEVPRKMHRRLKRYFQDCLKSVDESPDAWKLLEEFDSIIEKIWGERTFREFSMPPRQ